MRIKSVGIIGAGVMGASIARCSAQNGFDATVVKWTAGGPEAAQRRFEAALAKDVRRGKLAKDAAEDIRGRVAWTASFEPLAECDLIVESVIEDEEVKLSCFKLMDQVAKPEAVLATNTSTLDVLELAKATTRAHRALGLHFFNPVPSMRLVEVVATGLTAKEAVDAAQEFARALGKVPIVVRNTPGFVVNRLMMTTLLEAVRMIQEGPNAAEVPDIDACLKLGLNHPMGPFELMDLIGLDVVTAMAERLLEGLRQPHFAPPPLLERLLAGGQLGRKSGAGFYDYADRENPRVNPRLADLLPAS